MAGRYCKITICKVITVSSTFQMTELKPGTLKCLAYHNMAYTWWRGSVIPGI